MLSLSVRCAESETGRLTAVRSALGGRHLSFAGVEVTHRAAGAARRARRSPHRWWSAASVPAAAGAAAAGAAA